jgi:hypothetical protein
MSPEESLSNQLLIRTSPGASVPNSLPPEALFILNLGPYLTSETQSFEGENEANRSTQLYALAEKLEEIADLLNEVWDEQHAGTDPDPNDEELLEEVWEYLNGVLTKIFSRISEKVETLADAVNKSE